MIEEKILIQELKEGNKSAFTFIFNKYHKNLVIFAGNYVSDREVCEDFVQNIFLKLWNDRASLNIEISLRSFLIKSIQNACLDHIRHLKIIQNYAEKIDLQEFELNLIDPERYTLYTELHEKLTVALEKLPKTYKQVFELNKLEGVKQKEISKMLNISERTVEDRMSKALVLLRKHLKDFLIYFILILIN